MPEIWTIGYQDGRYTWSCSTADGPRGVVNISDRRFASYLEAVEDARKHGYNSYKPLRFISLDEPPLVANPSARLRFPANSDEQESAPG